MSAQASLDFLDSLPLWDGRSAFDLAIISQLAAAVGNPQDSIPALHVAGTNGKGTVCALLAAMLRMNGMRVGQCSSPHLQHVTERCVIDGKPVESAVFAQAIDDVRSCAERLALRPSYFEYVTMASFLVFQRAACDVMVVEVGLGGRLDATNIIAKPLATVVTSIDLDHTHILGSDVRAIAAEKAGIAKPDVPMIVGDVSHEARKAIRAVANSQGAAAEFWSEDFSTDIDHGVCQSPERRTAVGDNLWSSVFGYQRYNTLLAVRVAQRVGLPDDAIRAGIARASWPGRLEWFTDTDIPVLLDAALNPARCCGARRILGAAPPRSKL